MMIGLYQTSETSGDSACGGDSSACSGDSSAVSERLKQVWQVQATQPFAEILRRDLGQQQSSGESSTVQRQLKRVQRIQATQAGLQRSRRIDPS